MPEYRKPMCWWQSVQQFKALWNSAWEGWIFDNCGVKVTLIHGWSKPMLTIWSKRPQGPNKKQPLKQDSNLQSIDCKSGLFTKWAILAFRLVKSGCLSMVGIRPSSSISKGRMVPLAGVEPFSATQDGLAKRAQSGRSPWKTLGMEPGP